MVLICSVVDLDQGQAQWDLETLDLDSHRDSREDFLHRVSNQEDSQMQIQEVLASSQALLDNNQDLVNNNLKVQE